MYAFLIPPHPRVLYILFDGVVLLRVIAVSLNENYETPYLQTHFTLLLSRRYAYFVQCSVLTTPQMPANILPLHLQTKYTARNKFRVSKVSSTL